MKKIDHIETALNRIISQWKKDPIVKKMIESSAGQYQDSENAIYKIYSSYSIDSITGYSLDILGEIVGQKRQGLSDNIYRIYLKAKIGKNVSSGTLSDIRSIWRLLAPNADLQILESYPCSISINTNIDFTKDEWLAVKSFTDVLTAGVRLNDIIVYDGFPFGFQGNEKNRGFDVGSLANALRF